MERIYSFCQQTNVPTGRLAFTDPNLQSITHEFSFTATDKDESEEEDVYSMSKGDSSSVSPASKDSPVKTRVVTVSIRNSFVAAQGYVTLFK
jgi:hypothetical protein